MRFVELHDIRYNDCREALLVNLDNVTYIQDNVIEFSDGRSIAVKEDIFKLKEYIRAINQLECKYDEYFKNAAVSQNLEGDVHIQNVHPEEEESC